MFRTAFLLPITAVSAVWAALEDFEPILKATVPHAIPHRRLIAAKPTILPGQSSHSLLPQFICGEKNPGFLWVASRLPPQNTGNRKCRIGCEFD